MMQSSNIVILSISLALLVRLWPSSSVVYGRSKGNVLPERGARSLGGDGVAVASDGPKRPYVLLIGIETLRADHVGCIGYSRDTTPTLDAIAKEGVVFPKAMATASWTMPAVMSVFTSLYPEVHGTNNYGSSE